MEEVLLQLESALELKHRLLKEVIEPFSAAASSLRKSGAMAVASAAAAGGFEDRPCVFGVGARPFQTLPRIQRSIALGVAQHQSEYRLALRVQRPAFVQSPLMERLASQARGEVDVRFVGRIDKRPKPRRTAQGTTPAGATLVPWYQRNTRPLLMGASVGHVAITAGTIGAFVTHGDTTCVLSNNHVLANENRAHVSDSILQRARYDGGRQPSERVARLRFWIELKQVGPNVVDAALAEVEEGAQTDVSRLRGVHVQVEVTGAIRSR